jgi:hypothetical protein
VIEEAAKAGAVHVHSRVAGIHELVAQPHPEVSCGELDLLPLGSTARPAASEPVDATRI